MVPLSRAEINNLTTELLDTLSQTQWACSSLTLLIGGSVNFLFRGYLSQPIQDSTTRQEISTVIVKHAKDHLSVNRDFPLDASRCVSDL